MGPILGSALGVDEPTASIFVSRVFDLVLYGFVEYSLSLGDMILG